MCKNKSGILRVMIKITTVRDTIKVRRNATNVSRARLTFVAFLLTFIVSRTVVILIMTRKMPDLFLHMGGTHVHHLNYGIFLLSAVAGLLLFTPLNRAQRSFCALIYGISMALTFDE